jgi:hypothetical protein
MANRYWVGGEATWDNTAGTKWAATSGGAGGETVPTASDDVFFDANSGGVVTAGNQGGVPIPVCHNLTMTGYTSYIYAAFAVTCYGSYINSTTLANITGQQGLSMKSTSTGKTLTSNGFNLSQVSFYGAGGEWTLQDDLTSTGGTGVYLTEGTLITNGKTLTLAGFHSSYTSTTRTLNISGSVINIGADGWDTTNTNGLTFISTNSTIKLGTNSAIFKGGGLTYNNIEFNANVSVRGSNTFNDLKIAAAKTVTFTISTTQTVSSLTSAGSAGNLATIQSSSAGTPFTLSKSSGTVNVSFMSIKDSTATGGATWNANDGTSVNVSGNTGWIFPPNNSSFFTFM